MSVETVAVLSPGEMGSAVGGAFVENGFTVIATLEGRGKPTLDRGGFPRTARGRRPYFFDDPNIDKLLAMIMALAGEVSVLPERLDTHEMLAAEKACEHDEGRELRRPPHA